MRRIDLPDGDQDHFRRFTQQKFFHNLDWLRGLSILLVIFHHVPRLQGGPLRVLQANGRYGVSLFFVISGFLIATLLLREKKGGGRIHLGHFYARRSLRIFPLYYAVLALYAVAALGFGFFSPENNLLFKEKLPSYIFYFSNLTNNPTEGPFFFAWSLAVEEQFYLVFGLLACWLRATPLAVVLAGAYFFKMAALGSGVADEGQLVWRILLSYEEPILAGVGLALALQSGKIFRALVPVLKHPATLAVAATGLAFMLASVEVHDKHGPQAQVLYALMALIVGGTCLRGNIPFLGNPLSIHVGKISYGIYLIHMIAIMISKKLFGESTWSVLGLATLGVVLGASLVYRYFEAPILRLKAKFPQKSSGEDAGA